MNKVNSNLGAPTIERKANRQDPSILRTRPKQMAWAVYYALQQMEHEAKTRADELRRWNALRADGQRADGQSSVGA